MQSDLCFTPYVKSLKYCLQYIYIYIFDRCFYPKQLRSRGQTHTHARPTWGSVSFWRSWESNHWSCGSWTLKLDYEIIQNVWTVIFSVKMCVSFIQELEKLKFVSMSTFKFNIKLNVHLFLIVMNRIKCSLDFASVLFFCLVLNVSCCCDSYRNTNLQQLM